MNQFTSYQIVGGVISFLIGFLCRMGLIYENKNKLEFARSFFTFIFSISSGIIVFFYTREKDYNNYLSIVFISLASFFGSELIPGLGAINSKFFTQAFKEFIRKWLNNDGGDSNEDNDEISR